MQPIKKHGIIVPCKDIHIQPPTSPQVLYLYGTSVFSLKSIASYLMNETTGPKSTKEQASPPKNNIYSHTVSITIVWSSKARQAIQEASHIQLGATITSSLQLTSRPRSASCKSSLNSHIVSSLLRSWSGHIDRRLALQTNQFELLIFSAFHIGRIPR